MTIQELFNKEIFTMTVPDLIESINDLLNDCAPTGKTVDDFTGGYVQQLKNSTQFVAYFGTKNGTKNRDTIKITIEPDEIDEMYMMLKAKIHDMRTAGSTTKISLAQRRLAKQKDKKAW